MLLCEMKLSGVLLLLIIITRVKTKITIREDGGDYGSVKYKTGYRLGVGMIHYILYTIPYYTILS